MDDAWKIVEEQQRQIAELTAQCEQLRQESQRLREENRLLREQLDEQRRAAARQAAPFRRRESKKRVEGEKKRPGREQGHAGTCRKTPEKIDEDIEVPLDRCPHCAGEISDCRPIERFIEEIPLLPPRVYRIVTWAGRCRRCGEIESTHPLLTSRGERAAKNQLGPRALALAIALNKHFGLSMRKTCDVLRKLFGLKFSPGGLSQAADRVANRLASSYDALVQQIRAGPVTFADETSWWVGGPGWWLWTFTTPHETVYHVDRSRGSQVVNEILGEAYRGVLVSDCLSTYDPVDCRKHKCIAHHLRAIKEAEDTAGQRDPSYLRQWKTLLKTVITLHKLAVGGVLSPEALADKRAHLEQWIDRLLSQAVDGPGDARIRNRLTKQRRHLLGCLYDLSAEPTNNRAERSLRPAVIARKISCGNKTDQGRRTWQTLASLLTTWHQRGQDVLDYLAAQLPLDNLPAYTG